MSTKKTIQINPELFKLAKTKKKKEKKELTISPVVSPNNLKNKLLKRIKEHKTKELNGSLRPKPTGGNSTSKPIENSYTDEFYGAIDYLSELSKKQKQQKALNNKTLKVKPNLSEPQTSASVVSSSFNSKQNISLELPPELAEPTIQSNEIFTMNYKQTDDVPYGCLKNGHKKTYREWKELSKPQGVPDLIRPPTPPKKNVGLDANNIINSNSNTNSNNSLSREQRLEHIKNKLRKLQDQETASKMKSLDELNKIENELFPATNKIEDLPDLDDSISSTPEIEELIKEREERIEKETPKQFLKKTVKRKFTLGKSDKLRRVAVLIKDRQTRKNILNTQKELKKTNITDVRKYLRQHGIIKVGTTCPPDILRKTFEAAMLTGEVTNTNKDTLLHNFLNAEPTN